MRSFEEEIQMLQGVLWILIFLLAFGMFCLAFVPGAQASDMEDELFRIITQRPGGYVTDAEDGTPVKVRFHSMNRDERWGFAELQYKPTAESEKVVTETRWLFFTITDGNVIEIAGGHYFVLSFDGMIFRITEFDTQRLIPADWQR